MDIRSLLLDEYTTPDGEVLVRVPFGYFEEVHGWTEEQFFEAYAPQQWAVVREERDRRIAETDWTQLADVSLDDPDAWATYRQALRDVTLQSDPYNIVFPDSPVGGG